MIRNIRINEQREDKYPAEDIPKKVFQWLENNKRHVDEERQDVIEGQVVVVLAGKYTSWRGVFVKRLPKNLVLVSGSSALNKMSFVVMNQRYIHPVSTFVQLEKSFVDSIKVDTEEIEKIRDWTLENAVDLDVLQHIDVEGKQDVIDSAIENECKKTKGLKTYFSTPFTLPKDIDPVSAFY
ncbi:large subunit ribosomal protein L6e [Nematocida sp. AWRm77]|nr:large subunit ribosomal protein L6e [Nematocida sp. AWRm77]